MTWLLVALGGAIGAMARYALALCLGNSEGFFPWPTFTANVIGCFLMGIGFVFIVEKGLLAIQWRYFLLVGLLGAFTTFSTFSIEVLSLLESHSFHKAGIYLVSSMMASLFAVFLGVYFTEKLFF